MKILPKFQKGVKTHWLVGSKFFGNWKLETGNWKLESGN